MQLREEKLVPWEMIGTTNNEEIALEQLLSIEGIERVSPVIQLDTEIRFGEYKLNCHVRAVHSSFLDVDISEGVIFHDDSNMPFILLNEAAAESFSAANDNTKVMVSANTSVIMELNNEATNGLVCGIFDDEEETPVVYMSYDFASRTHMRQSESKFIFALSSKGDIEQIVPSLQEKGISAIYDYNEIVRWETKGQQIWQFVFVSVAFWLCATVLMENRCLRFDNVKNEENYALAIAGMTIQQLKWIAFFRLFLIYIISLITVCWIAFFTGIFSILAVIICIISLDIHFILLNVKYIN